MEQDYDNSDYFSSDEEYQPSKPRVTVYPLKFFKNEEGELWQVVTNTRKKQKLLRFYELNVGTGVFDAYLLSDGRMKVV